MLNRHLNGLLILFFVLSSQVSVWANEPQIVSWLSSESQSRIERSKHKADFFALANQFESQTNRIFCGPTCAAIVLNALRTEQLRAGELTVPLDESLLAAKDRKHLNPDNTYVFNRYTQNNIFDTSYRDQKEPIKTKHQVLGEPMGDEKKADWGFQLKDLAKLLSAHGLEVTARVVADTSPASEIRRELIQNLRENGNFVLVNYARKSLGQAGGGHISPLGAYDEKSDSFLIMDVNPNTDNWVWVKSEDLIAAMRTFDTVENRGYLLIEDAL